MSEHEIVENTNSEPVKVETKKELSTQSKSKTKTVKVTYNNTDLKYICVDFDGCGLRFDYTGKFTSNEAKVRYTGEIGSKDFECKLVK